MGTKFTMINIYNNEPEGYSKIAISTLQQIGHYFDHPTNEPIHAIITRLNSLINKEFLNRFPHLKFILTATTGLDHIDQYECDRKGIRIISLKGEDNFLSSIVATAEHTMSLMLALLRNVPAAVNDVHNSNWDRMKFKGHELKGKNITILGMGRLGMQIARLADAFQMTVKGFDTKQIVEYPTSRDLATSLHGSDILSIHLPYDSSTEHLISQKQIMEMNPNSYIINTSRGHILKEEDVVASLINGHLAGVAVDVLENEYNLHKSPLWEFSQKSSSNVIITPHIGGCTYESMEATEIFIAQQFLKCLHN